MSGARELNTNLYQPSRYYFTTDGFLSIFDKLLESNAEETHPYRKQNLIVKLNYPKVKKFNEIIINHLLDAV